MSESKPAEASASAASAAASAPKNEGNAAFRAMGLPRLRKRLPSRNWMIFFGIVGSFSGAVIYDKKETRRIQQKYCDAVSHLADEQLRSTSMPRKLRIFLAAPPGDYLLSAREYFKEYVKPILVASAVDWEVFEGRKEGDVRWKLAETIREQRRKAGEGDKSKEQEPDLDDVIVDIRKRAGISDSEERGGDLVIGRHAWKEYVRGSHEGWLGPAEAPKPIATETSEDVDKSAVNESQNQTAISTPNEISDLAGSIVKESSAIPTDNTLNNAIALTDASSASSDNVNDASATAAQDESATEAAKDAEKKDEEKKPEPDLKIPLIRPSNYSTRMLPSTVPEAFPPSVGVGFPHLLGFLNTPIRIWRFLNRRQVAESTGAAVAAFILAPSEDIRPFGEASQSLFAAGEGTEETAQPELNQVLRHEERDWHKSARKPNEAGQEDKERPWQEDMVLDSRLTSRMRTIDVRQFISTSGLAEGNATGPTDLAGSAVASAAGNVLTGRSGGSEAADRTIQHKGPRHYKWKGAADRLDPLSWTDYLRSAVGMELDRSSKPWQQGFEGDEEP